MQPIQLFDPASSTYTYVIFDESTREAVIIDPVDEQWSATWPRCASTGSNWWTIETHAHRPHHQRRAAGRTPAPRPPPAACGITTASVQLLKDGDQLRFGSES
jgi:sulfur dioxygenase